MKIAILGAGALGTLFGSRLVKGGNQVILVDPVEELVAHVAKEGVYVTTADGEVVHTMIDIAKSASEAAARAGTVDLIMVFTKGMHTEEAVIAAKPLVGDNTYFMSLQNGIGNPQVIAKHYPEDRILYGVTIMGAVTEGFGKVSDRSVPGSNVNLTSMKGVTPELEKIAQTMTESGLPTVVNADADKLIWEKLAMNCVANSSSVITRMTNGHFMSDPNGQEVAKMIVREVCEVANAKGIPLEYEKLINWIIEKTAPQTGMYSSMAQDVMRKRPIEIETITGGVIVEAEKLGVPVPVNKTIYYFDKVISSNYDKQF